MVRELIAQGLRGDALIETVMRRTLLPRSEAMQIIAIETGQIESDVIDANEMMPVVYEGEVIEEPPVKLSEERDDAIAVALQELARRIDAQDRTKVIIHDIERDEQGRMKRVISEEVVEDVNGDA